MFIIWKVKNKEIILFGNMKSVSCFWSFREDGYYVENFTVPAGICLFFRNVFAANDCTSMKFSTIRSGVL